MAKGYALTVGLCSVSAAHYQGWDGALQACEADAKDMAALLKMQGYRVTTLLTKSATRAAVLTAIANVARRAKKGDIFVYTNSSHGGQLPDLNGDEPDGKDETICMYDGELVDDEIYVQLAKFPAGVRILVMSDSCHSGTMTRDTRLASARSVAIVSAQALFTIVCLSSILGCVCAYLQCLQKIVLASPTVWWCAPSATWEGVRTVLLLWHDVDPLCS